MTTVTVHRHIAADPYHVFAAATDIERFPDANPDVIKIEFVTEQHSGVGTRFRETRAMGKRSMVSELEVTEYDPAQRRVRMVTDLHGTVWDTVFEVAPAEGGSQITARMDCRAHKLLPKLMNPLMKGFFRKGMEKHMDAFAAWCERGA